MVIGARKFVGDWVRDHVHPTGYELPGDTTRAKQHASNCGTAASGAGITGAEIEKQLGNLIAHMAHEMNRINDAEAARRAKMGF